MPRGHGLALGPLLRQSCLAQPFLFPSVGCHDESDPRQAETIQTCAERNRGPVLSSDMHEHADTLAR